MIPRGMIAGAGIYAVLECFMVLSVYQWTAFHLSLMILAVLAAGRIDPASVKIESGTSEEGSGEGA